jgi:hypothetical protein
MQSFTIQLSFAFFISPDCTLWTLDTKFYDVFSKQNHPVMDESWIECSVCLLFRGNIGERKPYTKGTVAGSQCRDKTTESLCGISTLTNFTSDKYFVEFVIALSSRFIYVRKRTANYWGQRCRKQFCLLWLPRAVDLKVSCSKIPRRAFAGIRTHDPLVESPTS